MKINVQILDNEDGGKKKRRLKKCRDNSSDDANAENHANTPAKPTKPSKEKPKKKRSFEEEPLGDSESIISPKGGIFDGDGDFVIEDEPEYREKKVKKAPREPKERKSGKPKKNNASVNTGNKLIGFVHKNLYSWD